MLELPRRGGSNEYPEPPRRGGSNEYPQSMFWSKNKKNRPTPAYPSFAIQKRGSRGYTLYGHVFLMNLGNIMTHIGKSVMSLVDMTINSNFLMKF